MTTQHEPAAIEATVSVPLQFVATEEGGYKWVIDPQAFREQFEIKTIVDPIADGPAFDAAEKLVPLAEASAPNAGDLMITLAGLVNDYARDTYQGIRAQSLRCDLCHLQPFAFTWARVTADGQPYIVCDDMHVTLGSPLSVSPQS